ncbi:hypothetical protein DRO49_04075 [Candidatus Bathyarchaeota archaeon]|nr:MAG: hypothetical protein DRO49_04075 [Candidatus Bathyarchaeota archaeon]
MIIGPDIVINGINISTSDNNLYVSASIWNIGNISACNFTVNFSLNSSTGTVNETEEIDRLAPGDERIISFSEHIESNKVYNITILADSEEEVDEFNEDNNIKSERIGPDIVVENINKTPAYPVIGLTINKISVTVENKGEIAAENFNISFKFNFTYLDANKNVARANETIKKENISLGPHEAKNLTLEWNPPSKYVVDLHYYDTYITVEADPDMMVEESDEKNNIFVDKSSWRIYTDTGYKANRPLTVKYHEEMVHCGINYSVGDSYYMGGSEESVYGPVHFDDVFPEDANVKVARLYLYWNWGYERKRDPLTGDEKMFPVELDVEVKFEGNGTHVLEPDDRYIEYPIATRFDVSYGTYAYNVTEYIGRENKVTAIRRGPWSDDKYTAAIEGMAILVIYEHEDMPMTTYWICEGADVLWTDGYMTGLTPEQCTTPAVFNGTADLKKVNATLWTIVPFGSDRGDDDDRLIFNNKTWHDVWERYPSVSGRREPEVSIDKRFVTEYMIKENNTAEFQDNGDWMVPSNAFLILKYPPDLVPYPKNPHYFTVMGEKTPINITIRNEGRSKAKNFSVVFRASEGSPREIKMHIDEIDGIDSGRNWKNVTFYWTAPKRVGFVDITIEVDADDDVEELINHRIDGEENNVAVGVITVELSEGSGPPTGGKGGTSSGGVGLKAPSGTVKGYLLNPIPWLSEKGGSLGFSFWEYLIKSTAVLVGISLLVLGFFFERRKHNQVKEG